MSRPVIQRKRLGVRKKYGNKSNASNKAETRVGPELKHTKEHDGFKSATCTSPRTVNFLSPSLSFGSDMNEEVLDLMDKVDCGIISSTPMSIDHHRPVPDTTAPARLDGFTPVRRSSSQRLPNVLYSREGMASTPITSQTSASKKSISIVQTPRNKANRSLSHWGLPEKVVKLYADKGVKEMFQWQAECLSMEGVLSGQNIIYSAPTSAGKTLVAELLLLKCILERRKKVIMILPFVSIVHEKVSYLQSLLESVGVKVGGFMGGHAPPGGLVSVDMAICTIEKANSLINRTMEEGTADQLGMVIVDELHMIGDHHRGYLLELLLTKLRYVCQGYQLNKPAASHENKLLQILGMSATLPNLNTLARWLNAVLYQTDFRPVPLQEMVKIGKNLYNNDFEIIEKIPSNEMATDDDEIAEICSKRVIDGHSVLIFCPTKAWCEKLATTLALHQSFQKETITFDRARLNSVLEQLNRTQVGVDSVLAKTLKNGIAFHHAGLTFDEREIIEGGFRQCLIRILVATSTLSSGVNLPARLVIVRTPIFHQRLIDIMMYKQMIGRAGRKGVDDKGESILVCKPAEKPKVISLLKTDAKPVKSCLGRPPHTTLVKGLPHSDMPGSELAALKRAVLEVIVNGTALLEQDIQHYLKCTLLYTELVLDNEEGENSSDAAAHTNSLLQQVLSFLCNKDFARERDNKEQTKQQRQFYPTQLGMATVASGLAPDEALIVFEEFRKARKAFVLENELHIIYLVTPVYILDQWPSIDWYKYYSIWEQLPEDMKHVADTVGVRESFIARAMQCKPPERTPQQVQRSRVHRRFFTSLALQDLVREVPVNAVSYKFSASKGLLQNLQSASGTFSGMVTVFCNKLGWTSMELLLSQFQSRLTFGIERELIDLVKVSLLNGSRARALFNAGYHNLAALATANPSEIEKTLRNAFPYKTNSNKDSDDNLSVNWCSKMKRGMSEIEAAREIIQEAKAMLCDELNIPESALDALDYKNNNLKKQAIIAEDNHSLRHARKIINKTNHQQSTSEGIKHPKLNNDRSPSLKPSMNNIATSQTHNISSTSLPSPLPQVIDFNCPQELSESVQSMEGVGSNLSLDLFKDLSLGTLAQLDAICDGNEINQVCKDPSTLEESGHCVNGSKHYESMSMEPLMANESLKELSLLHSTTCSESGLTVIDVTANVTLLQTFMNECKDQSFLAFSVATESIQSQSGIGNEVIKPLHTLKGIQIPMSNEQVVGVAFSWGDMDTYYVSLCESCEQSAVAMGTKHGLDMSLIGDSPPIPLEYRIKCLASLFSSSGHYVIGFNVKKQVKHLMLACHIDVTCKSRDPKVADWLLDPDNREKTLNHMILKYLPEQPKVGESSEATLSTMATHSPFPYLRASAECILAEMLMQSISKLLTIDDFTVPFEAVEMPVAHILAKMEVNGIGFSSANCDTLREQLQCHLTELEQEAYTHAGRVFALTSPEDVSIVLFNELKLPSFQTNRPTTGKRRVQHLSTSKDILEKIKDLHPLPGIVLEWRRVSGTVSRTLFPLVKASVTHSNLKSNRIHSTCQIHTATGRITFLDPNLQNVPNEYPVGLHKVSSSVQQSLLDPLLPEFDVCATSQPEHVDRIKTVCIRNVFTPFPGGVLIAADYSQLELRLLAHLSNDTKLCCFLNQDGDAFRMIASEWLSMDPSSITNIQRQQTKQICYGMVYGIGAKALGAQMGVSEEEAYQFIDTFKSKYPQLKEFITSTIADCREKGYVLTIKRRKRFLPHINSTDIHKRAQAERQAVNSTIQGSAADLVKIAMINVDRELQHSGMITSLPWLQSKGIGHQTNIALPVLQLHDELVYEVNSSAVLKVADILKKEMENAMTLRVPFPVKIKSGLSWGKLEEISIP